MQKVDKFTETLTRLTVPQIKIIAQACGSGLTGRKGRLVEQLRRVSNDRITSYSTPFRLVSVDLGIRNIGVTQLVAPPLNAPPTERPFIEKWFLTSVALADPTKYPEFSDSVIRVASKIMKSAKTSSIDGVVIEQQRARSASSAKIPNSILAGKIIEGMMFTALRLSHPELFLESVLPRSILNFWRPPSKEERVQKGNYLLAKKVRKDLVDQWLATPSLSPVNFDSVMDVPRRGKRDDLNDSLVQGLTWINWRRNSFRLLQNIESDLDPMFGLEFPETNEDINGPPKPRPRKRLSKAKMKALAKASRELTPDSS